MKVYEVTVFFRGEHGCPAHVQKYLYSYETIAGALEKVAQDYSNGIIRGIVEIGDLH